jgi:basic amino acid/polyamine antiporter, APA family
MQAATQPPGLHRVLGFWALTAYGVGDILGAGIYALVGQVAARAGDAAWLSFLTAVAIASLSALSFAELAGRYPRSAGEAYYVNTAFGREGLALFVGWLVLASAVVSMATVSRAAVGYASVIGETIPPRLLIFVFMGLLALLTYWGMRISSAANLLCTVVEACGLLLVIGVGLWWISSSADGTASTPASDPAFAITWGGVLQGGAIAFFAFIGFEDMVNVAEEVKRPERNLPLALLSAVALSGSLYMIIAWVALRVVPASELATSTAPLLEVVRRAAPGLPPWTFALIPIFAVTNTALLNFVTASRLLYGMSRQELLPAWLGSVHPRYRTPHLAIGLIFVAALAIAWSGSLGALAGVTSALILIVFFLVNASLAVIQYREPPHDGFRAPRFVAPLGALGALALVPFAPGTSLLIAGGIASFGALVIAIGLGMRGSKELPAD